jgi:hypothetical protein
MVDGDNLGALSWQRGFPPAEHGSGRRRATEQEEAAIGGLRDVEHVGGARDGGGGPDLPAAGLGAEQPKALDAGRAHADSVPRFAYTSAYTTSSAKKKGLPLSP